MWCLCCLGKHNHTAMSQESGQVSGHSDFYHPTSNYHSKGHFRPSSSSMGPGFHGQVLRFDLICWWVSALCQYVAHFFIIPTGQTLIQVMLVTQSLNPSMFSQYLVCVFVISGQQFLLCSQPVTGICSIGLSRWVIYSSTAVSTSCSVLSSLVNVPFFQFCVFHGVLCGVSFWVSRYWEDPNNGQYVFLIS